jgi:hypothetical protein
MVASGRLATRSGIDLAGPTSMASAHLVAAAMVLGFYQATPALPDADSAACPEEAVRCIEHFGGRVIKVVESPAAPGVDRDADPACPPVHRGVKFLNTHFTDLDLVAVAGALMQIEDLERVDLSYTRVKGESLACLAWLPSLKELDLSAAPISGDGLHALACLGPLERLKLNRASLYLHDLFDMQAALGSRLKMLHISGAWVLDPCSRPMEAGDILNWVVGFTKLEDLGLAGTLAAPGTVGEKCGVTSLTPLKNLKCTLTRLDLSNNNLKTGATVDLTQLENLNDLRLRGNADLRDSDLAPIGKAGRLKVLDLSGTQLTDGALIALVTDNKCLVDLNIAGTFTLVNRSASDALSKLSDLKTLNIGSTGVRDETFRAIWRGGALPNLTYVDISGTMVTDRGLASAGPPPDVGFRKLNSINIAGSRVTNAGLNHRNALLAPVPQPTTAQRTKAQPAMALPAFHAMPIPRVKAVTIPAP